MPNELINQNSPYLLQHAHNPVHWYPWNQQTLEKARQLNKPLIVSIGYAACHWCHVMENQSFTNPDIAKIMNDNFICIKVDREERPDVDMLYMNAIQLTGQAGGWPLNAFALPNTAPFYIGTYFPPQQWSQVLQTLAHLYKTDLPRIKNAANQITKGLNKIQINSKNNSENKLQTNEIHTAVKNWTKHFDSQFGGNNQAPKFPIPVSLDFLLTYNFFFKNTQIHNHIFNTLDHIAAGGIFDQLRGGFARYSVDKKWLVPHFEKMLYDNAQLVSIYAKAYKTKPKPIYKLVVYKTLNFINQELTSTQGGFFSSLNADSDGEEGKYYVWKKTEISEVLANNAKEFCKHLNISENGNWEHQKNILHYNPTVNETVQYILSQKFIENQKKLIQAQKQRARPTLDNKILLAWNALMSIAYLHAYDTFLDSNFLKAAEKNIKFIEKNLIIDNKLFRSGHNSHIKIHAFLDDYALLIKAYIKLAQSSTQNSYLIKAYKLAHTTIQLFFDPKSSLFFYNQKNTTTNLINQKETSDNVIPSSNSVMAQNLYSLSNLFHNQQFKTIAHQMLLNFMPQIKNNITFHANWAKLLIQIKQKPYEIITVGTQAEELQKKILSKFQPHIFAFAEKAPSNIPIFQQRFNPQKTLIYPCQNNTCQLPFETTDELWLFLSKQNT